MPTLQYVGARYVPVFYSNPDGSWDWESGVQYEPLTIVKYGENSYTSRSLVPATVGSPNLNPEYWALTGSYNGFLQYVTERVNNTRRKYILIGDSFGDGVISENVVGQGWIAKFKSLFPDDVYIDARGSKPGTAGFTSTRTFLSIFQYILGNVENPEEITDIIVMGGTNDAANYAQVPTAIQAFVAACQTSCRNATIRIGCLGTYVTIRNSNIREAYASCRNYGCCYLDTIEHLFCLPSYISDGTHLTQAGYDYYFPYIADCILKGYTRFSFFAFASSSALNGKINFWITESSIHADMLGNDNNYLHFQLTAPQNELTYTFTGLPILNLEGLVEIKGECHTFHNDMWTFWQYCTGKFVGDNLVLSNVGIGGNPGTLFEYSLYNCNFPIV